MNTVIAKEQHGTNDPYKHILCCTRSWKKIKRIVGWILMLIVCLRRWCAQRKLYQKQAIELGYGNSERIEQIVDQKMLKFKSEALRMSPGRLKDSFLSVDVTYWAETLIVKHEQNKYHPGRATGFDCW